MTQYLAERGPYLLFVLMIAVGTQLLLTHRNFLKALVGLYLLQTASILFFILLSVRTGATIPVLPGDHEPALLHNPLPHALMLTAIVVGVSTQGVAMAILRRLQAERGSIEEQPEEADA